MLGLEDGGLGEGVDVIGIAHLVVVLLGVLQGEAILPREGQVLVLLRRLGIVGEIVFHMALRAYQGTHLVMRGLVHVFAHARERLAEGGPGDMQVHGLAVVAVRATDRIHHVGAPLGPVGLVELRGTHFFHQAGHIRALAGPAGPGLVGAVNDGGGEAGAEDFAMVFDGVE